MNQTSHDRPGREHASGPKEMHAAVCSTCGAATRVPFLPDADRPVFCKDCYQSRRPSPEGAERGMPRPVGRRDRGPHGSAQMLDRAPRESASGMGRAQHRSAPAERMSRRADHVTQTMGDRQRGTVKWFNEAKGFGFIRDETGEELFVHCSAIEGEGFRTLHEGDRVEFDVVPGPKGRQTANVVRID